MRPSFAVEQSLEALGRNLKVARLRRRLPQQVLAERAGIGLTTLNKIEKGDCGVAIGNVAAVMLALGLGTPLSDIAQIDEMGLALEGEMLPKRIRSKK